ncbi:MAG TPA: hypothetical protein VIK63_02025 [Haloplasmataceae bacterium]
MNRSHKQQLEKLKSQNEYDEKDLEMANELLKQDDPPFKEDVRAVQQKIKRILRTKRR